MFLKKLNDRGQHVRGVLAAGLVVTLLFAGCGKSPIKTDSNSDNPAKSSNSLPAPDKPAGGNAKDLTLPKPLAEAAAPFDLAGSAPNEVIITLHQAISRKQFEPVLGTLGFPAKIIRENTSLNSVTVEVPAERQQEARLRLGNHPYVAAAGLNRLITLQKTFNDPALKVADNDDWGLRRIGAFAAWDITEGGALIAVIDSGSQLGHEELSGKTTKPYSYFTNNGNMQMGLVDVRIGNRIVKQYITGHGTHVAVTAAGRAENAKGTAGVAPASDVMPIQVLYYQKDKQAITGSSEQIRDAISRAIDNGAKIINMSLGVAISDDLKNAYNNAKTEDERKTIDRRIVAGMLTELEGYKAVLDKAQAKGVIIVKSAGNQSLPAKFDAMSYSGRVISVAATARDDSRANESFWGSNYGDYTTVSAPGHEIWSATPSPGPLYGDKSGTSMAAPHVAGVVALLKSIDPDIRFSEVYDILRTTGIKLNTDKPIGPLVQARAAVDELQRRRAGKVPPPPAKPPLITPPTVDPKKPELPPSGVKILDLPEPWKHPDVQRLIDLWLSIAIPKTDPPLDPKVGPWFYDKYGRFLNNRNVFAAGSPNWAAYRHRFLWERSKKYDSTNHGTLYDFVKRMLAGGTFSPTPAPIVPPPGAGKKPVPGPGKKDPIPGVPAAINAGQLRGKWAGSNSAGQRVELVFFNDRDAWLIRQRDPEPFAFRLSRDKDFNTLNLQRDGKDAVAALIDVKGTNEIHICSYFSRTAPRIFPKTAGRTVYVLKRTSTEPGQTDPLLHNFRTVAARVAGSETRLIGGREFDRTKRPGVVLKMTDGFGLHHSFTDSFALSRDGKWIWVILSKSNGQGKAPTYEIQAVPTDGGTPVTSQFTPPDKMANMQLDTNGDGSVAYLMVGYHVPEGAFGRRELKVYRAERGTAFQQIVDTKDNKDIASIGLAQTVYPRVTADGRAMMFNDRNSIWRVGSTGQLTRMADKTKIFWDGVPPPGNSGFAGLEISADGSHWISILRFQKRDRSSVNTVVVGGKSGASVVAESKSSLAYLDISADGETITYFDYADRQTRVGKPSALRKMSPLPGMKPPQLYAGRLFNNGRSIYAEIGYSGTSTRMNAFIEDLGTGSREMTQWGLLLWPAAGGVQLSEDGSKLAGAVMGPGRRRMLAIYERRNAIAPGHPALKQVLFRHNDDGFTIRVAASDPKTVGRIQIIPLHKRFVNTAIVDADYKSNPFFGWRNWGGTLGRLKSDESYSEITLTTTIPLDDWLKSTVFRISITSPDESRVTHYEVFLDAE